MDKNTQDTEVQMFHVHSVLDLIFNAGKALTVEEMKSMIAEKFGANCLFASCSIQGMSIDQAIEFLFARQKLAETEPGKFVLNMGNMCNH